MTGVLDTELSRAAIDLVGLRSRAVLGIAGVPGAGKSTLAEGLVEAVRAERGDDWVAHLPMDGFHLADAQLDRLGLRDCKGAPNTFDVDGYAHTLARVAEGETDVYVPGFERTLEQPIAAALVVPATARLVITEGNYLLLDDPRWQAARRHLDEVWFVTGDDSVRVQRLIARHVHFGKTPDAASAWVADSDERNARLVEATAGTADRVVLNDGDFHFA